MEIKNKYDVDAELRLLLTAESKGVIVGAKYLHYKGGRYLVRNVAIHTETDEVMIVYESLSESFSPVFVRPLKVWARPVARNMKEKVNNLVSKLFGQERFPLKGKERFKLLA